MYRSVFILCLGLAPACAPEDGFVVGGGASGGDSLVDEPQPAKRDKARGKPWRPRPGADTEVVTEDPAPAEDTGTLPADTGVVGDDTEPSVVLDPVPYGYWGLNGYHSEEGLADVHDRLGMGTFQTATSNPSWAVGTLLPMARAAGITVTLRMTGGTSGYTSADGSFDVEGWKDMLDPWADSGVQEFIDDGTLVGHMLLDDIHNFTGADPTGDELDELARYSKALLPGLMTFVRDQGTTMPEPSAGTYRYLDACVNQYNVRQGDIDAYVEAEHAAAVALDLGIINGLNIANGGDGSSGQAGWQSGRYAMSADEITTYGEALAAMPGLGLFLNWEYDGEERWSDGSIGADYFDQPEVQAALAGLAETVAARERTPLMGD